MGTLKTIITSIIITIIVLIVLVGGVGFTVNSLVEDKAIQTLYGGRIVFPSIILPGDTVSYLKALQKEQDYHIIIDSFGGSAFDTIAIINRISELQDKGFNITTEAYGYTLSGGAFIFIMGDDRIIHDGAALMFHGAGFAGQFGKRESLRDFVLTGKTDLALDIVISLAIIDNKFAAEMHERLGFSYDDIVRWLYAGDYNYMTSDEALELGVATEVR